MGAIGTGGGHATLSHSRYCVCGLGVCSDRFSRIIYRPLHSATSRYLYPPLSLRPFFCSRSIRGAGRGGRRRPEGQPRLLRRVRGRKMSQKEAFRQLSWKFHGKGPSKKRREKRMHELEKQTADKAQDHAMETCGVHGRAAARATEDQVGARRAVGHQRHQDGRRRQRATASTRRACKRPTRSRRTRRRAASARPSTR